MNNIEDYNTIYSVYPLMYWTKNEYISEYSKNAYYIHGRGSGFIYKTDNAFYFITAKHNFTSEETKDISTEMSKCFLLSNPLDYKADICISDSKIENYLKLFYIPIKTNNDLACYNDICIFQITGNFPNSKYCLYHEMPPLETNDNGYIIGYPTFLKESNEQSTNITKAILPIEIAGINTNDILLTYKHSTKLEQINGFSGAPLLQYYKNEDRYIFMGMTIRAGSKILNIIPSYIIQELISDYENSSYFIDIK